MNKSRSEHRDACPLCCSIEIEFYHQDKRRTYLQCLRCDLVFVPEQFHLSEEGEKAEYLLHQNDPRDVGYRQFLQRLADPLLQRLSKPSRGLDFGCGPGPTLHLMLQGGGHTLAVYDKFFANDVTVLEQDYEFITATEVVEHLSDPGGTLSLLWKLLLPRGFLALMTKRVTDKEAFSRWHYKNDPTHIAFFSESTFLWLADQWQAECDFYGSDVVIFRKVGK